MVSSKGQWERSQHSRRDRGWPRRSCGVGRDDHRHDRRVFRSDPQHPVVHGSSLRWAIVEYLDLVMGCVSALRVRGRRGIHGSKETVTQSAGTPSVTLIPRGT